MNKFEGLGQEGPENNVEQAELGQKMIELADTMESLDTADIENSKNPKVREKVRDIQNSAEWKLLLECSGWATGTMLFAQDAINHPEVIRDPQKVLYALGTGVTVVGVTKLFKQIARWAK